MPSLLKTRPILPRPGALRWEIAAALLLKIILLFGLWFLIFRWNANSSSTQPDVAERFALPASQAAANATHRAPTDSLSPQPNHQEPPHVW